MVQLMRRAALRASRGESIWVKYYRGLEPQWLTLKSHSHFLGYEGWRVFEALMSTVTRPTCSSSRLNKKKKKKGLGWAYKSRVEVGERFEASVCIHYRSERWRGGGWELDGREVRELDIFFVGFWKEEQGDWEEKWVGASGSGGVQ